jgi:uncharacterized PurR-regulated membrane protein YhhQ (DUF165 family)
VRSCSSPIISTGEIEMNKKWYYAIGYMSSIIIANLAVAELGLITWFGWLTFPAGAIFIGLTFSLRDFVQREWGDRDVWYFMIASTVITTFMGLILSNLPIPLWRVAIASAIAFIISEAIDWSVYYFMKKDIIWRICVSNIFSTPIDSILFVGIAFGSFSLFEPPVYGQTIVKYLSGLLVIPVIWYYRKKTNQYASMQENYTL